MPRQEKIVRTIVAAIAVLSLSATAQDDPLPSLTKLPYNNPGLIVDLGVGLWAQPLPMDYDGDGDYDMVVATNDVPSNGIYFFENPDGDVPDPVFKPAVRIGAAQHNITVVHTKDGAHVLTPGNLHPNFTTHALSRPQPLNWQHDLPFERIRADQWKLIDYNGNGLLDILVGVGVWDDYGWDDAFNADGEWTNGPLHGFVYVALNEGTKDHPQYGEPTPLATTGPPIDVYGAPSPNLADFDGDGDLDLICGEFLDRLAYFENVGSRHEPRYAKGRYLSRDGELIRMELQMLQVIAMDWDKDGDPDLIVGQEDGRVAFVENSGDVRDGMPIFERPRFFRQESDALKAGVLPTPVGVDWDHDGDDDLLAGDTAGYINFIENLDGDPKTPRWAAPVHLEAGGETIRIQAGTNGGIQGPCEAKWGYTVISVADWNHDGRPDIVLNSIWGEVLWYENIGTQSAPKLAPAKPIVVDWKGPTPKPEWLWWTPKGKQLVTQWRTSPFVGDINGDGLNDLVMLDTEGYLSFFERTRSGGELHLQPGKRVFVDTDGKPLRLNSESAGPSGRRKFTMADWDGDGRIDLLINGRNIDFGRNVSTTEGLYIFDTLRPLAADQLAGHTTCPAIVDWNHDQIPDLVIGAEDGFFYYLENPRSKN